MSKGKKLFIISKPHWGAMIDKEEIIPIMFKIYCRVGENTDLYKVFLPAGTKLQTHLQKRNREL